MESSKGTSGRVPLEARPKPARSSLVALHRRSPHRLRRSDRRGSDLQCRAAACGFAIVALARDTSTVSLWNLDGDEGISADTNWTPPAAAVTGEPERETDKDWVDARFSKTDTGPYLNATIDYQGPKGKLRAYKGTAIRVGTRGEAAFLFDRCQLRFATAWTGGYLNHSSRRFGLLNTPTSNGKQLYTTSGLAGWANGDGRFESSHPPTGPLPKEWGRFKGIYLNGPRTILAYTIGGVDILDRPWAIPLADRTGLFRHLDGAPTKSKLMPARPRRRRARPMFKRSGVTRVAVAGSDDDALAVFAVGPGNVAVQIRLALSSSSDRRNTHRPCTLSPGHKEPHCRCGQTLRVVPHCPGPQPARPRTRALG